ncbi:MAG: phosphoribosylformylglycinamidine cyclo-ligase [Candidatus Cloacimonetes bacterium HGW-Cloacimonetes-3]|jgi:phosphoribosylformylglycinamidine cyclo-ligase|nr:MAG: phosphoribosylformylglycinamidine cyclo-ligase [Candidatus Cloacimonetes bacterium HGW-Cloacimonetes-3]
MDKMKEGISYSDSGVNIAAGEAAVKAIKNKVRSTYNANVLSDLGSFGGLYKFDKEKWETPVLVSSTDGVGTKLRVAIMAKRFNTIGQDLVNHCVNDILVQGAIPQFFLDYIGVGKLDPEMIEQVIDGLIIACTENSCALIGGEMAEMPGIYHNEDFDLAGTIVGMVEQNALLPRDSMCVGDQLVGLPSSGLHTNGYSLVRRIVFDTLNLSLDTYIPECEAYLSDLLLAVHRSYLGVLKPYLDNPALRGLAHITGGGIGGNLRRILPETLGAKVRLGRDDIPPFFHWLRDSGNISNEEMQRTFNLGIGMICVVDPQYTSDFIAQTGGLQIGELCHLSSVAQKVVFE